MITTQSQADLSDAPAHWPVESSEQMLKNPIVSVRRDMVRMPDGQVQCRDMVVHPGAVAVVALNDARQVLLVRQYRHPVAEQLWELPAGLRDVPGEPAVETARRELHEEAGYQAAYWQALADAYTSPGFSTELVRFFLARQLTQVPAAERVVLVEEEAHLEVGWHSLDYVISQVLDGKLRNGLLATGVLAAFAALRMGITSGLQLRRA